MFNCWLCHHKFETYDGLKNHTAKPHIIVPSVYQAAMNQGDLCTSRSTDGHYDEATAGRLSDRADAKETPEQKWVSIYKILFPHVPEDEIPSPCEFVRHSRLLTVHKLICSALEDPDDAPLTVRPNTEQATSFDLAAITEPDLEHASLEEAAGLLWPGIRLQPASVPSGPVMFTEPDTPRTAGQREPVGFLLPGPMALQPAEPQSLVGHRSAQESAFGWLDNDTNAWESSDCWGTRGSPGPSAASSNYRATEPTFSDADYMSQMASVTDHTDWGNLWAVDQHDEGKGKGKEKEVCFWGKIEEEEY